MLQCRVCAALAVWPHCDSRSRYSYIIRSPLPPTHISRYNITTSGVTKKIDSIERLAVDFSVDCDTGLYAGHNAKAAISRGGGVGWLVGMLISAI